MRCVFLGILIILLNFSSIFSATYYFAANGNDSYTAIQAQNPSTPWQSLDKFNSLTLTPQDSVLFKRGDIFRGGIIIKQSGTSDKRITIGAYGTGNNPVIVGTVAIQGWTIFRGSIYVADYNGDLTKPIEQVLASGFPLKIARYPNKGYLLVDSVISSLEIISKSLVGTTNWTGASIHIKTERWSLDWRVIASFDPTTGRVTMNRNTNYSPQKGWGFFINNNLNALDEPGEWFYDSVSAKIYLWMPNSSVPQNIEASIVPYGLYASSKNYITVENLKFAGHSRSGIYISGSNNVIRNCAVEYADLFGIEASLSNSSILNCSVKYPNQTGIELNGSKNKLSYDTIIGVAMMNRINRKGLGGTCCTGRGINSNGDNDTIVYCILDSIGYIGIGFSGQSNIIEKNLVSNVCMTTDDGGGIYTWNDEFSKPGSAGTVIRKNIVINGVGAPEGGGGGRGWVHGIYLDDRSHNILIDSNTVINNELGIFLHNNRYNTVFANVCYANRLAQIQIQRDAIVSENVYGNRVFNNVFFCTSDTQSTIKEEIYSSNDSSLVSIFDNLIGVENLFGIECRKDNVLLWRQSYINTTALRVGANKIRNGNFDSTSLSWGSWPSQYFSLSVDSTKSADKRCLKICYFGDPAQGTPIFQANGTYPIVKGKLYCLRFYAVENHAGHLTVICRMGHSPYTSVGLSRQVGLDTVWQNFEILFEGTISDSACRVDFQVSKSDSLIWLDSVSLYEINDEGISHQLRSRCFYNANEKVQSFSLGNDSWRDVNGTRGILGSIMLQPFLSQILIKDSIGVFVQNNNLKAEFYRDLKFLSSCIASGYIKISFELTKRQSVLIEICNLRGVRVYFSDNKLMDEGKHTIYLSRKTHQIAPGIYILKFICGSQKTVNRFVIVNL